jgi:DNA integrity scanning protein DisA with diadenylate cyclase activity
MGLMQLPKVIEAINELALKVQKLEIQVQSLLNDKNNEKVKVIEDPIVNKKPVIKRQ